MDLLQGKSFNGEGLLWGYDDQEWCIGIKNYKAQNSLGQLTQLERHHATDESFVPVAGDCCLLVQASDGSFQAGMMEHGALYTVPRGFWHSTVTKPGAKLVIIERSGTTMDNSELLFLDPTASAAAIAAVEATGFWAVRCHHLFPEDRDESSHSNESNRAVIDQEALAMNDVPLLGWERLAGACSWLPIGCGGFVFMHFYRFSSDHSPVTYASFPISTT